MWRTGAGRGSESRSPTTERTVAVMNRAEYGARARMRSPSRPAKAMGSMPETPKSAMPSMRLDAGTTSAANVKREAKSMASETPWRMRTA